MNNFGQAPIKFMRNRVWRIYRGGRELERFLDIPNPEDGHYPEEWLASTTPAANGENQQNPEEGLSRISLSSSLPGPLLKDYIAFHPKDILGSKAKTTKGIGVLCKYVDSAVRLPVQCHPDRIFSRKYYKSQYGKEESWFIIGTRNDGPEEPYLLMGFRPNVKEKQFTEAAKAGDSEALINMLHRFPVKPGEAYLIPGRFRHAIGPGVLLLEVQEPTDFVIQPEKKVDTFDLSETERWGGLDPETALECFDFRYSQSIEGTYNRIHLNGRSVYSDSGNLIKSLVGEEESLAFRVDRLTIDSRMIIPASEGIVRLLIIIKGEGILENGEEFVLRKGDTVMLAAGCKAGTLSALNNTLVGYIVQPVCI